MSKVDKYLSNARDRVAQLSIPPVDTTALADETALDNASAQNVEALLHSLTRRASDVRLIPVDLIDPDPNQPRDEIDQESDDFKGLVNTIQQCGLIQPLVVEIIPDSKRFLLISGERRLRAIKKLALIGQEPERWKEIECVVKEKVSRSERLLLQLIENIQRKNFEPVEYARGMFALKESLGKTVPWKTVEDALGISETRRKQYSRLLQVADTVEKLGEHIDFVATGAGHAARNGTFTEMHGRALWMLQDHPEKLRLFIHKIRTSTDGISGHDAVRMAQEMLGKKHASKKRYSIQITPAWTITIEHDTSKELILKIKAAIEKLKIELKDVQKLVTPGARAYPPKNTGKSKLKKRP